MPGRRLQCTWFVSMQTPQNHWCRGLRKVWFVQTPQKKKFEEGVVCVCADSSEAAVQKFEEGVSKELVELLISRLDTATLVKFVRTFLLESNASGNRWLAHSLVLQIYRYVCPVPWCCRCTVRCAPLPGAADVQVGVPHSLVLQMYR